MIRVSPRPFTLYCRASLFSGREKGWVWEESFHAANRLAQTPEPLMSASLRLVNSKVRWAVCRFFETNEGLKTGRFWNH